MINQQIISLSNSLSGGLIVHWKFDELTGIRHDSTGKYNISPVGNVGYMAGKIGNAVAFDGSNSLTTTPFYNFANSDFTISYWINIASTNNPQWTCVFNTTTLQTMLYGDVIHINNNVVDFPTTAMTIPVIGEWAHVVYVNSGGMLKGYMNNVLMVNIISPTFPYTTDFMWLGSATGANHFTGGIDLFSMWNHALSELDINTLYNNGAGLDYERFANNGLNINTFSPFNMVLATSAFTPKNKIWKAVYDFGNGDVQEKLLGVQNTNIPSVTTTNNLTNGLIAHWNLDETSGNRLDLSGNGYNLDDNLGVSFSSGVMGNAAKFLGSAYLSSSTLTYTSGSYSVAGWINFDSLSAGTQEIISFWGPWTGIANGPFVFVYGNTPNSLSLDICGQSGMGNYHSLTVPNTIDIGTWYFLVLTWDAATTTATAYFNGQQYTFVNVGEPLRDGSISQFEIGAGESNGTGNFYGAVDSVSFWSRPITPDEVSLLYNNGKGLAYESFGKTVVTPLTYMPFMDEPGDPRNGLVTTNYYFDDAYTKTFTVTVSFYEIGVTLPEVVTFDVNLTLPNVSDIFGSSENIKLVGSRMFGLDDQLLYMFESQDPNYLIPTLIKF